jgi:hypothetical protein
MYKIRETHAKRVTCGRYGPSRLSLAATTTKRHGCVSLPYLPIKATHYTAYSYSDYCYCTHQSRAVVQFEVVGHASGRRRPSSLSFPFSSLRRSSTLANQSSPVCATTRNPFIYTFQSCFLYSEKNSQPKI